MRRVPAGEMDAFDRPGDAGKRSTRISLSPNSRSATMPRRRQYSMRRFDSTIGADCSVYLMLSEARRLIVSFAY